MFDAHNAFDFMLKPASFISGLLFNENVDLSMKDKDGSNALYLLFEFQQEDIGTDLIQTFIRVGELKEVKKTNQKRNKRSPFALPSLRRRKPTRVNSVVR